MTSALTTVEITLDDAIALGVEGLVRAAETGTDQIIARDSAPVAVVMSFASFNRLRGLERDTAELAAVASRMARGEPARHAVETVLERFGAVREEGAAEVDEEDAALDETPSTAAKRVFRPVNPATHPLLGRWRIVAMDIWDRSFIDLIEPGYIAFDARGGGEFVFGAVTGHLNCGYSPRSIDFTWGGDDDGHESFGDGWATLEDDGAIAGEIRFHDGDESGFRAERW